MNINEVEIKKDAQVKREEDSYYYRILKVDGNQILLIPTRTKLGKEVTSFKQQTRLMVWVNHNDVDVVWNS